MSYERQEFIRDRLLEQKRAALRRRDGQLARIGEELESREPAWEDAAAESSDATLGDSLADFDRRAVHEIDRALERLDQGSYGRCVECGQAIDAERLELLPATPLCADCAFAADTQIPAHTD